MYDLPSLVKDPEQGTSKIRQKATETSSSQGAYTLVITRKKSFKGIKEKTVCFDLLSLTPNQAVFQSQLVDAFFYGLYPVAERASAYRAKANQFPITKPAFWKGR